MLAARVLMRLVEITLLFVVLASICGGAAGVMVDADAGIISMIEDDGVDDHQLGDDASVASLEGSSMGMDERAEFDEFTKRHQKKYKDSGEYKKRFSVWRDNLSFVRKWNSDGSSNFKVSQ